MAESLPTLGTPHKGGYWNRTNHFALRSNSAYHCPKKFSPEKTLVGNFARSTAELQVCLTPDGIRTRDIAL